jgi:hypothetical protein
LRRSQPDYKLREEFRKDSVGRDRRKPVVPSDMILRARTHQVDGDGKGYVGENENMNYTGEVGYLVLGLVKP